MANVLGGSLLIILTHLAYRANAKKHDISNTNSQFWKCEKKRASWHHLLLQNDVSHGFIRQCNVVFMLERYYKYM